MFYGWGSQVSRSGGQGNSQHRTIALHGQHDFPDTWTALKMETSWVYVRYDQPWFKRAQLPITMTVGVTVHHSQGCSFDRTGLYLNGGFKKYSDIQKGSGCAAISRPKNLPDFKCQDLDREDFEASRTMEAEIAHIRL